MFVFVSLFVVLLVGPLYLPPPGVASDGVHRVSKEAGRIPNIVVVSNIYSGPTGRPRANRIVCVCGFVFWCVSVYVFVSVSGYVCFCVSVSVFVYASVSPSASVSVSVCVWR
jgi:hypothetical protein